MKKIKVLHWFLVILIVLFAIGLLTNFYVFKHFERSKYFIFLITSAFSTLIVLGLFFMQRALFQIIKNGYFNTIVGVNFKRSGLCFLLSGFGSAAFNIFTFNKDGFPNSEVLVLNLITYFLLIMIGLGLFVILEFVENGNVLKQENDLTI